MYHTHLACMRKRLGLKHHTVSVRNHPFWYNGCCALLVSVMAHGVWAVEPVVDIFPPQTELHTHGSNVQYVLSDSAVIDEEKEAASGDVIAVWFAGDGERTANTVKIVGAMQPAHAVGSWSSFVPLTTLEDGHPHINPAFSIQASPAGTYTLSLFWSKIFDHTWQGSVIHINQTHWRKRLPSLDTLAWAEPGLTGYVISEEENVPSPVSLAPASFSLSPPFPPDYWQTIAREFENTWPLYNGWFAPEITGDSGLRHRMQGSSPQQMDISLSAWYRELKQKLETMSPSTFQALKNEVLQRRPDMSTIEKKIWLESPNAEAFFAAWEEQEPAMRSTSKGVFPTSDKWIIGLGSAYRLWDAHIAYKMRDTLLNPSSPYYGTGWQTRSQPLAISLADGTQRLLLPVYADAFNLSLVFHSDDGGRTWHRPNNMIMSRGGIQPTLLVRKNGTVVAYMRNNGSIINLNSALVSYSYDQGMTWTPAEPYSMLPNVGSSLAAYALPYGDYAGYWAVVYNVDKKREVLEMALSPDQGHTWVKKILANGKGFDQKFEYPAITQSADGAIHITFTHKYGLDVCAGQRRTGTCETIGSMRMMLDKTAFAAFQ